MSAIPPSPSSSPGPSATAAPLPTPTSSATPGVKPRNRAAWLKTLHQWHWISSALCLVGMVLFALTGITLNHAGQIESRAQITRLQAQLPAPLQQALLAQTHTQNTPASAPLPAALRDWVQSQWDVALPAAAAAEWSEDEIYLALPRPGGDAWLRVTLMDGSAEYERSDRGWIAYFNDLHKGRHTGAAWSWFLDIFSIACLVFCATGLLILQVHAGKRPWTWPITGLGLILPLLLVLLLIH